VASPKNASGEAIAVPSENGASPLSVSVVIPTYNRASLLPRAIASALNQTCPPLEVIVVDDGSSDDTADRCLEWGDRIRYVRIPNGGVAAARNAGISKACGDWIALLDSDDWWQPTKLEAQVAAHQSIPAAAWSITGCELVDDAGQPRKGLQSFAGTFPVFREVGCEPEELFAKHLQPFQFTTAGVRHAGFHGDLFGLLFFGNVALPSSALIRRSFLTRIGGFDSSLRMAEETEFFHRAAAYSPALVLMEGLVCYRAAGGDSITAGRNAVRLTEIALQSLDAAASRRPMHAGYRAALSAGRRNLLLRLAYVQLSERDGTAVRQTLRRLAESGEPAGRRGAALWAASLLPPFALSALHRSKRLLRRITSR
jgi:GT2 family glycosyltransferase